jgi:hypothetical protein
VETARSPGQLFFNGRLAADDVRRIRPRVSRFVTIGERGFRLAMRWQADDVIPDGYRPFLHFCDQRGEIVFQAAQDLRAFDATRQGEIPAAAMGNVPNSAAVGDEFELRAGLYNPGTGQRLPLAGHVDGEGRIRLGTVRVKGEGGRVTGLAWAERQVVRNPLEVRQNREARPIDFGPVATAGGVRLTRDGPALVVTPLPGERVPEFEVRIRWDKLPWQLAEPATVEVVAEDGTIVGRDAARRDAGALVLVCRPGVFQYRLVRSER